MKNFNVSKTTTKTKDEDERRKRKTKTASIEKEQKERRNIFQNKRACVRALLSRRLTYLAIQPADRQAVRQRSPWKSPNHWETPINYRKCPNFETNERTNVKRKT